MFHQLDDGLGIDPPMFDLDFGPMPLPGIPDISLPMPGMSLPPPPPPFSRPLPPLIPINLPIAPPVTSVGQVTGIPAPAQPKTSGGFDLKNWLNLASGVGSAVVGTVAGIQAVKQGLRPAQGYPAGYYQTPTGQVVYQPQSGGGATITPYGYATQPADGVGGVFSLSPTGGLKAAGSTNIDPIWFYLGGAVLLVFLLKKK